MTSMHVTGPYYVGFIWRRNLIHVCYEKPMANLATARTKEDKRQALLVHLKFTARIVLAYALEVVSRPIKYTL